MISLLGDRAPLTRAREWLYKKGDELGMSTLMNVGVDPYIRTYQQTQEVGMRDADQRRDSIAQRGYDPQRGPDFPQEMSQEILPQDMGPFEMTGRRFDNFSKLQREKWREAMLKSKNIIRRQPSDGWEPVEMPQNFGYSMPKTIFNSIKNVASQQFNEMIPLAKKTALEKFNEMIPLAKKTALETLNKKLKEKL